MASVPWSSLFLAGDSQGDLFHEQGPHQFVGSIVEPASGGDKKTAGTSHQDTHQDTHQENGVILPMLLLGTFTRYQAMPC
jgi:hypothetical protein